ncbi:MAG: BatA domain-containing protein, partial [Cryomorphaceae bacterium]|nr:BatA domain-containing protein [Cryomorphaceae bacterium]
MFNISFSNPEILWLMALLPLLWIWVYWRRRHLRSEVKLSHIPSEFRHNFNPMSVIYFLRTIVLVAIIVALAGPRSSDVTTKTRGGEGIEIVLA